MRLSLGGRLRAAANRDPSAAELLLAAMSVTWGLFLLAPFDAFGAAPAYALMSQLWPEPMWGGWFAASGSLSLAVQVGGYERVRRWSALLGVYNWLLVAFCFLYSSPTNTGGVVYTFVGLAWMWIFLRLSRVWR